MFQLEQLKPNPKNPRFIKDEKFKKLCKSLQEFPKMMELRPIIYDEAGIILGGNMRYKALLELGYTQIPEEWVRKADTLTEDEKNEFIIKDNVSYGEWEVALLRQHFAGIDFSDWGLDIETIDEKSQIQDDGFEIPATVKTDIIPGDLFQIGNHRLLCGDATSPADWDKLMQGTEADLINADPPYNVDYHGGTEERMTIQNDNMADQEFYNFLRAMFNNAFHHTKKGGSWYIFHADSEGRNFRNAFEDAKMMMKQCLIWKKSSLVLGRQDYQWIHEPILYGWKPGAAHFFTADRSLVTVWQEPTPDFNKLKKHELIHLLKEIYSEHTKLTVTEHDKPQRNFEHPTMKPIPLVGELIANSSRKDDVVVDFCGGSGTTLIACEQLQRRGYLMEKDPKFVQVTIDRIKKYNPGITVIKNP